MTLPRSTLAKYITPGCAFIETGARWGDSVIRAYELGAGECWTCEIDPIMCVIARQHISDARRTVCTNISECDSVSFLYSLAISSALKSIVLFLDAHTDTGTRIIDELLAIRTWPCKPNNILIDDVRLFRSKYWGVGIERVIEGVNAIASYDISYDDGAEAGDVLIARRNG